MWAGMDPEARAYLIAAGVAFLAFIVMSIVAGRCLTVAEREQRTCRQAQAAAWEATERADQAEADLYEWQQRLRTTIDEHFRQTPAADPDDTVVMAVHNGRAYQGYNPGITYLDVP